MSFKISVCICILFLNQSDGISSLPPLPQETVPSDAPDVASQQPPEMSTPTPEPEDCAGAIEQCRDDFGNSPESRKDLLVLRQCVTDAPCDANDDDKAERDRALFIVNSNEFHWIPADDPRETNAGQRIFFSRLARFLPIFMTIKLNNFM